MNSIPVLVWLISGLPGAEGCAGAVSSAQIIVRSVDVRGNRTPVELMIQVGDPYNASVIEKDVRRLWDTGRFGDIRVETAGGEDGIAVNFQVVEARALRLRKVLIEPSNLGVRVQIPESAPVNRERAQAVAREARKQLASEGYAEAQVIPELVPVARGQADLHLTITPGDRIRVTEIHFVNDGALDSSELAHALRALRIRRVFGWRLLPDYSPEAVDADLVRLRSVYLSRGYFDARVRVDSTEIHGKNAEISVRVDAGARYRIKQSACDFCAALLRARREAERHGILDFYATLSVRKEGDDSYPVADVSTTIERGSAYRVGRIEFLGNHHYSDAMLRRNFLIAEGQLLDGRLLRKSVDRLNRSNLFESIDPSQVIIHPREGADVADVIVKLTERKRGAWRLSGPVGPASFAGPLEASISTRLPPWGSGLFELATYTASVSMFAFARPILPLLGVDPRRGFAPLLALARPFSPGEGWKSGFSIAPQLGWRASALGYTGTQIQQRLLSALAGDRGLVPELAVTVEGPGVEGVLLCEPPGARFAKWRYGASVGIRVLGALAGI